MRKAKVARISRVVLKWLIPAHRGRWCEERTGRNLDLPRCAGYRAREMSARTTRPNPVLELTPPTENVYSGRGARGLPSSVYVVARDLLLGKLLADWTTSSAGPSPSADSFGISCFMRSP